MSKPQIEWCKEHLRHEEIPACYPDFENTIVYLNPDDEYYERELDAQEDNHLQGPRRQ